MDGQKVHSMQVRRAVDVEVCQGKTEVDAAGLVMNVIAVVMTDTPTAAVIGEQMNVVNREIADSHQGSVKNVAVVPKIDGIIQQIDIPIGVKKILLRVLKQQSILIARHLVKMTKIGR